MIQQAEEEEEILIPVSDHHVIENVKNASQKVTDKAKLGSTDRQTFCVRYDYYDKYIAAGHNDGTIRIYNMMTEKEAFIVNKDMEDPSPITNIKWRPPAAPSITKNVLISISANGALQHWHTTSGKLLHTIYDEFNQLLGVDYKPDGCQFAAAGSDTVVRVYDEATRKLVSELKGSVSGKPGHSNRVFCCKFDKENENILLSGGWDHTIQIWDLREGGSVRSIYGPKICGESIDIREGYIVTGSYRKDNQIEIWKCDTGDYVGAVPWDEALPSQDPCYVYSMQFRKGHGNILIAGGAVSNEVKLFDTFDYFKPIAQIRDLSRACFTVDFAQSGDSFAMGGGDGVVRVFNLTKDL